MVSRRRLLAIGASGPSSGGLCKLRSHIIWFSRMVLVNAPRLRSTISSRVLEVNVHTSCGISLQVCEWAKSGRGATGREHRPAAGHDWSGNRPWHYLGIWVPQKTSFFFKSIYHLLNLTSSPFMSLWLFLTLNSAFLAHGPQVVHSFPQNFGGKFQTQFPQFMII